MKSKIKTIALACIVLSSMSSSSTLNNVYMIFRTPISSILEMEQTSIHTEIISDRPLDGILKFSGISETSNFSDPLPLDPSALIVAEYCDRPVPYLDGVLNESFWDAEWDIISYSDNKMNLTIKHNKENLYLAATWDASIYDTPSIYFEDDGVYRDYQLDSEYEDEKYVGNYVYWQEGAMQDFYDAHWDDGWTVEDEENHTSFYGAKLMNNTWYLEANIVINVSDPLDIYCNSNERMGFMFKNGFQEVFPTGAYQYTPNNIWADLQILWDFPNNTESSKPTGEIPEMLDISEIPIHYAVENDTSKFISWQLSDNAAGGLYKILRNGKDWEHGWQHWRNNEVIQTPINTNLGVKEFNYTIIYCDALQNWGEEISQIIRIQPNTAPQIEFPSDQFEFEIDSGFDSFQFTIIDDQQGGNYSIVSDNNDTFILSHPYQSNISETVLLTDLGFDLFTPQELGISINFVDLSGAMGNANLTISLKETKIISSYPIFGLFSIVLITTCVSIWFKKKKFIH